MTAKRARARRRDRRDAFWRAFAAADPWDGSSHSSRTFQQDNPVFRDLKVRHQIRSSVVSTLAVDFTGQARTQRIEPQSTHLWLPVNGEYKKLDVEPSPWGMVDASRPDAFEIRLTDVPPPAPTKESPGAA